MIRGGRPWSDPGLIIVKTCPASLRVDIMPIMPSHGASGGAGTSTMRTVPHTRTAIRIHVGNWVKDTSGCVLVGMEHDANGCMIKQSRKALTEFTEAMGKKPFLLDIREVKP